MSAFELHPIVTVHLVFATSVSRHPYNWSQILQSVKYAKE